MQVQIIGLPELIKKLGPKLVARPMHNFFERSTIAIENRAKQKAPTDTGRLKSSITHKVDDAEVPHWGQVGTNVKYAPYMEFGTGTQTDGTGKGARHWPPSGALDTWARRHGFQSGYQVARAIGLRGGLKPRRFLRDALKESLNDIRGYLDKLGKEIKDNF